MVKRVGDLLGLGLFLISIWLVLFIFGYRNNIIDWGGIAGGIIIGVTQIYYLTKTWGTKI